jgi:nicotinamidase-related amidase
MGATIGSGGDDASVQTPSHIGHASVFDVAENYVQGELRMAEQRPVNPLAQVQAAVADKRGKQWAFPALTGSRTALVACEVSRLGLALAPRLRASIPRIDWLARTLRASGGKVFWSKFSAGAFDGPAGDIVGEAEVAQLRKRLSDDSWTEVSEGVQGIDDDRIVTRKGYSAIGAELLKVLRAEGIDTILIAGAETDGAVDSTARAAASAGMRVIVVSDCCISSDEAAHTGSLIALHRRIADVRPADEIVAELRRTMTG